MNALRPYWTVRWAAQVMDFLGAAAFSKAVQALDIKAGRLVCLKIIKNNKDYFDQSLDEIKLLNYVNAADPHDEHGMLRLHDYFYYKARPLRPIEVSRAVEARLYLIMLASVLGCVSRSMCCCCMGCCVPGCGEFEQFQKS